MQAKVAFFVRRQRYRRSRCLFATVTSTSNSSCNHHLTSSSSNSSSFASQLQQSRQLHLYNYSNNDGNIIVGNNAVASTTALLFPNISSTKQRYFSTQSDVNVAAASLNENATAIGDNTEHSLQHDKLVQDNDSAFSVAANEIYAILNERKETSDYSNSEQTFRVWSLFHRALTEHLNTNNDNQGDLTDFRRLLQALVVDWQHTSLIGSNHNTVFKSPQVLWSYLKSMPTALIYDDNGDVISTFLCAIAACEYINPVLADQVVKDYQQHLSTINDNNNNNANIPLDVWYDLLFVWSKSAWKINEIATRAIEIWDNIIKAQQSNSDDYNANSSNVKINNVDLQHLLKICEILMVILSKCNHPDYARVNLGLLKRLKKSGLQAQIKDVDLLTLRALALSPNQNDIMLAGDLLQKWQTTNEYTVTKHHFLAMMIGYALRAQYQQVAVFFNKLIDWMNTDMHDDNGGQDTDLFCADDLVPVITAYTRSPNVERAQEAQKWLLVLESLVAEFNMSGTDIAKKNWSNVNLLRPTINVYNAILTVCAESHHSRSSEGAELVFSTLVKDPNVKPNINTYNALLKSWARSDRISAISNIESTVSKMRTSNDDDIRPTLDTYNHMIYAYSRYKDKNVACERADAVFRELEQLSATDPTLRPNEVSYVAVMTTWNRSEHPDAYKKTDRYFEKMLKQFESGDQSVRPSLSSYVLVLYSKMKQRQSRDAEVILDKMIHDYESGELRFVPYEKIFVYVVSAFVRSEQKDSMVKAQAIVDRMISLADSNPAYTLPSTVLYDKLIEGWANSNSPDAHVHAEAIINKLRTQDSGKNMKLKPTSYTHSLAMLAWARSNLPESADRTQALFKEMLQMYRAGDSSMKPPQLAYDAVLMSLGRDSPEKALAMLREMEQYQAKDPSYSPVTPYQYSIVIDAYAEKGFAEQAELLLRELLEKPHPMLISSSFNSAIKAYCRNKSIPDAPEKAEYLLRVMQKYYQSGHIHCAPSNATYVTLLYAWLNNPRPDSVSRAEKLLREQIYEAERGQAELRPDEHTFLAFLRLVYYCKYTSAADKSRYADEVKELAKAYNCDFTLLHSLIATCRSMQSNKQ